MRLPGKDPLQPLPEDPDMVLVHHDGRVMSSVRNFMPRLLRFTERYSKRLDGPLMNSFWIDRWLLADLEAQDFEAIARELQGVWTDEVIDQALRKMPPEWYAVNGAETAAALRTRRDNLVDYVLRVYRYYADKVDVHATDRAERVAVARSADDTVEITVSLDEDGASPHYRRRFVPSETSEVRLYLHGGDDRVERTGPARGPIKVRVVAGGGSKVVDDSASGGTDVWRDAGAVGGRNARAYRSHRFAGDSSLYGSAELRFWFGTRSSPIVPVRVGVFGLVESGRVWLEGEDSNTWHTTYGGGLLFQPLGSPATVHATVATGDEGTHFRFGTGYAF
jgi:hypothetical protein